MGYLCDYCREQRSIVFCRSDAASLCLSCDRSVHSANSLSKRHSRTLVCERCHSQPAFVRCIEERISLCQNCDWMGHAGSNVSPAHKKQAVNCYSGCPSASELSAVWSFLLDVGDSTCEQMSITDHNRPGDCRGAQETRNFRDSSVVAEATLFDPKPHNSEQQAGSTSSSMSKVCLSGAKGPSVYEDDAFYNDFNMDEVDLSIENYEELFGVALNDPKHLLDDDGIDGLFGTKDMSGSNCLGAYTAEGSSVGGANMIQPACSNAASADSVVSSKTEPNLYFTRQALSFSGLTGESSSGDYQDCSASSSMKIMGEPPWYPPAPEISMPSSSRNDAVMRYMEKKKTRKFEKKVRYESRKARADVRRRVKGRFVKAGETYDYDPLSHTRSC
ncbi:hypothetical protein RD792_006887 [Penstemon davidsonii]|uniref:Uncharacterized protein n=1 Tax=Penstemon davidsonii TaxID=160366 RepID=A0ABR0D504_9LAMI|nr:hypothetical protein RD792_006887 [Penstemon davidsonii]